MPNGNDDSSCLIAIACPDPSGRIGAMAKGKAKPTEEDAEDKPLPPIRIAEELHPAVRKACKRFVKTPTEYIKDALREKLERDGLWPPKDDEVQT